MVDRAPATIRIECRGQDSTTTAMRSNAGLMRRDYRCAHGTGQRQCRATSDKANTHPGQSCSARPGPATRAHPARPPGWRILSSSRGVPARQGEPAATRTQGGAMMTDGLSGAGGGWAEVSSQGDYETYIIDISRAVRRRKRRLDRSALHAPRSPGNETGRGGSSRHG